MKRIAILTFIAVFLFSGCELKESGYQIMSFSANNYVSLPNYHNYSIPSDTILLTDSDINSIICMNMSSHEWYKPIDEARPVAEDDIIRLKTNIQVDNQTFEDTFCYYMGSEIWGAEFEKKLLCLDIKEQSKFEITYPNDFTLPDFAGKTVSFDILIEEILMPIQIEDEEFICSCYGFNTIDEVKLYFYERATKNIIFEYVMKDISEKAMINIYPIQLDNYIKKEMNQLQYESKQKESNIDEYALSVYGISTEELKQEITDYFTETMIMKAILENEGYTYSPSDYDRTIERLAKEANIEKEDIFLYYDDVSVWYELLRSDLENLFAEITVIE